MSNLSFNITIIKIFFASPLHEVLTKLDNKGDLYFGFHVSRKSIMSCFMRGLEDGRIYLLID